MSKITRDKFDRKWESDCGMDFSICEGTPSENNMVFCCKCGKPLVEHPYKEIDK